jgi:hypothetical protein
MNSGVADVEVWVLDIGLRFEAVVVAGKSQENIFGVNDTEMARTETVESIQEVAAPEGPPSAFRITSSIQTVRKRLEVVIVALLDLQIQLEPARRSQRRTAEIPCVVRIVVREIVKRKKEARLDELDREPAVIARISSDRSILNAEWPVFRLEREDSPNRK